MKHSHFERRQLGAEEEGGSPHVRRKLFSIQAAAEPEEEAEVAIQLLEWMGEADPRENQMTAVGRLWSQQRPLLPPPKTEHLASTSGKKAEKLRSEDSEVVQQQQPVVYSDYRTSRQTGSEDSDSDDGGGGGQTSSAAEGMSSSRASAPVGSSAYKRSLSRALSSDAFATRERKPSVTNCPPCKASKNVTTEETVVSKAIEETPAKGQATSSVNGLEETPTTSQPSQRLLMKTRSSTRINGGKSLLSSFQNPPDEKPKPMLTPKSLKSSKKSLSRAFTTTNLKVQSNDAAVSETPSEPLPKPSRKLVSSITTSCLKSFQEFHISPESKAVAEEADEEEEHDLPVPRPTFARSNSKKFQKPAEVNNKLITVAIFLQKNVFLIHRNKTKYFFKIFDLIVKC